MNALFLKDLAKKVRRGSKAGFVTASRAEDSVTGIRRSGNLTSAEN